MDELVKTVSINPFFKYTSYMTKKVYLPLIHEPMLFVIYKEKYKFKYWFLFEIIFSFFSTKLA